MSQSKYVVLTKKVTYTYTLTLPKFTELVKETDGLKDLSEKEIKEYFNRLVNDEDFAVSIAEPFGATTYRKDDDYEDRRFDTETEEDDEENADIQAMLNDFADSLVDYHNEIAWSTIYYRGEFAGFCGEHPHLQDFKTATYYQTYGGGPEGGYLVMPDKSVYTTDRNWGTPFSLPEKVEGELNVCKMNGEWKCRLI